MKICGTCHIELPLSQFGAGRGECRPCRAAYGAAYRAAHREELKARQLKRYYGLTPAERVEMSERQAGLCVCGLPATDVDHCHKCEDIDLRGSVRGLLCHPCNHSLDHIARFSPIHAAYLAPHAAVCPNEKRSTQSALIQR